MIGAYPPPRRFDGPQLFPYHQLQLLSVLNKVHTQPDHFGLNMPDFVQFDLPALVDNFPLKAQRFDIPDGQPHKAAVVICNANGIPARFYRDFALWLTQHGVSVLTFDYRYLGLSWPPELAHLVGRGSTVKSRVQALRQVSEDVSVTTHWGARDIAAAIRYAADRWKGVPLVAVGHSMGAILLPLLGEERHLISRFLNVCAGNGFVGNYDDPCIVGEVLREMVPLLEKERIWYTSRIGVGLELPYGIGREIADWIAHPRHSFLTESSQKAIRQVDKPYLAVGFEDDYTLSKMMLSKFLSQFSHADRQKSSLWVDPDAQRPPWAPCGHVMSFAPSESFEPSEGAAPTPKREETIWAVYLNWILTETVDKTAGEYKIWGPEDESNPLENEEWEYSFKDSEPFRRPRAGRKSDKPAPKL
ncbi:alpha/beta-hydrolase [Clavulina sp. PMI_390]|nr:alpha/beta-hydrolase [Clavulina sp. PMI_390]